MPTRKSPRKGSLQFWPRKRASKFLPSVNWKNLTNSEKGLKGVVAYKAGMVSIYAKDNTESSRTKGKNVIIPGTVLECPSLKIFSVRFYKNGKIVTEILNENLEKELKRKVKLPKGKKKTLEDVKNYDDISVIVYTQVNKTELKKKPDLAEVGLNGGVEEKFGWVKENLGKEISASEVFEAGQLIDIRGVTKGKGLQGPVKRFGLRLKHHKSEKGRRGPGSIAPWHPARITFRSPMAGQMGMFTRATYNNKILDIGKDGSKFKNMKNYGDLKKDYIVVFGSIQGATKRQLVLTPPLRQSKKQLKKQYEVIEYR